MKFLVRGYLFSWLGWKYGRDVEVLVLFIGVGSLVWKKEGFLIVLLYIVSF